MALSCSRQARDADVADFYLISRVRFLSIREASWRRPFEWMRKIFAELRSFSAASHVCASHFNQGVHPRGSRHGKAAYSSRIVACNCGFEVLRVAFYASCGVAGKVIPRLVLRGNAVIELDLETTFHQLLDRGEWHHDLRDSINRNPLFLHDWISVSLEGVPSLGLVNLDRPQLVRVWLCRRNLV